MTEPRPPDTLHLDERQRAMLEAMGVTVWWPAPTPAAATSKAVTSAPAPAPAPAPAKTVANNPYRSSAEGQKDHKILPLQHPLSVATLDGEGLRAAIGQCQACGLCRGRTQPVPGTGLQPARWMVVLDGPSEQEDRQGSPLAAPEGPLLQAMLAAMGLDSTADVCITHAVKCRGGPGRNPSPDELAACRPYLTRQLELVQPAMVLALGRLAAESLLGAAWPDMSQLPLGKLRGQVHTQAGVPVVVSYPPHSLMRSPAHKAKAWEDLCLAMTHIGHTPLHG